jgi:TonB-like protein
VQFFNLRCRQRGCHASLRSFTSTDSFPIANSVAVLVSAICRKEFLRGTLTLMRLRSYPHRRHNRRVTGSVRFLSRRFHYRTRAKILPEPEYPRHESPILVRWDGVRQEVPIVMHKPFWIALVVGLAASAFAQLGKNCPGDHPELLRDSAGKILIFTPQQLKGRAVKQVKPEFPELPQNFGYDGYVTFKVLIDTRGEVACLWGNAGLPVLAQAADEAGRWWKFRPVMVNGKAVEYLGTMKFHSSTASRTAE